MSADNGDIVMNNEHLAEGGTEKAIVNGEMVEMIKRTLGRI